MDDILAPVVNFTFDFESFLEKELGLYLNDTKKPFQEICKYFLRGTCRHGNACQFRHERSDKTVMCKHWLRGLCKKGDHCEFRHVYDMRKMPECWFYSNYGECSNAECAFLHIDPESKIKECPWYSRGFCKHGPLCRNKHIRTVICQRYLTGFCPLGPDCPLGHPKYELPRFDPDQDQDVTIIKPSGILAGGGMDDVAVTDPVPRYPLDFVNAK